MKRFWNYFLSMAMIASLLAVTSCGDDTTDGGDPVIAAPGFEITGVEEGEEGATTASVGEEVTFTVNVTAPGGFNRLLVEKTVGADGTTETYEDIPRSGTVVNDYTYTFSYTPTAEEAGQTIYFDFLAVDDADRDNTYQYVINVEAPQVTTYQAVLLAAPTEDQTNAAWFSSSLGQTFSTADVNATTDNISGEIDFGYRYGQNARATLASPAVYPEAGGQNISTWNERRETMLRRTNLTPDEFMEQGDNAQVIMDAYENGAEGTNPQLLTQLQEGEVLVFMTDPDKAGGSSYGLIHVREIDLGSTGSGFGSDASITLDVKVTE